MSNEVLQLGTDAPARIALSSYSLTLPMGTLAIGVDNIHHDVYLSPKFAQAAKDSRCFTGTYTASRIFTILRPWGWKTCSPSRGS